MSTFYCAVYCMKKGRYPQGAASSRHVAVAYLNFGNRNFISTPMLLLICHCCKIVKVLFVIQYSTKPAGKKKNMTENAIGMIHINRACSGSGGTGFKAVCMKVVAVITAGKM